MQKDKVWERPWNGNEAAHFFGVHPDTIKEYRKYWYEGVHYFRLPGYKGEYRYNPELLKDWLDALPTHFFL
ncbi:hypothetical protein [Leptolyngbya sp. FACHB-16]|uniref:hypothetical protein n=1 Tax=unclassified Leptolyngbya TaxID=2650499 RepID=UPI0016897C20|nr:hypothetical protein [Leptolyngbya sp. FACHB-16]MBD2156864.1 hypothetical protein [Leptolyngbya sp. FACHB-16]